jgi:hypothetical protein
MYNYVCAIYTFTENKELNSYAIKVGVTKDPNARFLALCKEVEAELPRDLAGAAVLPLFIVNGNYDKYVGERIEDILRLYYLRKLGFNRGYKQDWINSENLPIQYDIENENVELENLLKDWFSTCNLNICHRHNRDLSIDENLIFSSFTNRFRYRYC